MNNYYLLLSLLLFSSCNGQHPQKLPADNSNAVHGGEPKIVRTYGEASGNIGCELVDKAGNIWFTAPGEGVYQYDGKSFTNFNTKNGLGNNYVSAIIEDKAGNILFGSRGGVFKYNGQTFSTLTKNDDVSKRAISCLVEDKEGNLWMGTMDSGVYRYDGKTFANFLNNNDHPFNLGAHYQAIIDVISDKKGNLWFCTWNRGGVWRYDGKKFINFIPAAAYYMPKPGDAGSGTFIPGILRDVPLLQPQDSISEDMVFSVSEDKAGNLWFATRRHGACRYDGKTFTSFTENKGLANKGMYAVLEDKKGNIWFGTEKDGVWRYDGKTFKNFSTKDGLINDSVFSILEDNEGNLWFGTRGFGLSRYDGKTFTSFT